MYLDNWGLGSPCFTLRYTNIFVAQPLEKMHRFILPRTPLRGTSLHFCFLFIIFLVLNFHSANGR